MKERGEREKKSTTAAVASGMQLCFCFFFSMLVSVLLEPGRPRTAPTRICTARMRCGLSSQSLARAENGNKGGGLQSEEKDLFFTSSRFSDVETLGRRRAANADLPQKTRLSRSSALSERFSPVAMKLSAICSRNFVPR